MGRQWWLTTVRERHPKIICFGKGRRMMPELCRAAMHLVRTCLKRYQASEAQVAAASLLLRC